MKTVLLIAVVICSAIAVNLRNSDSSIEYRNVFLNCMDKAGVMLYDVRAFNTIKSTSKLGTKQENFLCCIAEPLISNHTLNTESVETLFQKHIPTANLNVSSAVSSCESLGVSPNNLKTCSDSAKLFQCLFVTLRQSFEQHK